MSAKYGPVKPDHNLQFDSLTMEAGYHYTASTDNNQRDVAQHM